MSPISDDRFTRIRSDYLGAGTYVLSEDERSVLVNTSYGVQAVGLDSQEQWKVELVERCLGVARRPDGVLVANTLHAVHQISPTGELVKTSPTRHEIAREPIPWGDGLLLITRTRAYSIDDNGKTRWKYRFRASLGDSVRAALVVGVVALGDAVVLGAVDHDSGIGRVLVIGDDGQLRWESEPAPITSLFAVGDQEFVYTIAGYGRFEARRATTAGEVRWTLSEGGQGLELPDGRLAILVGNNEAPAWENWELRITDADGGTQGAGSAQGRCPFPPTLAADGNLYFAGFYRPFDPAESRIEYTSYTSHPNFAAFDFLLRGKCAGQENEVFYFRGTTDAKVELLFKDENSMALGPTVAGRERVFFVHGRDLLALEM